jgi:uncharacterized damage-inducible protein DinB
VDEENETQKSNIQCARRTKMIEDLRYPIGRFEPAGPPDPILREKLLNQLEEASGNLRTAIDNLSPSQLDTPYKPGGWTVRQVVHHLADAQMNWYIRAKLALTEDNPTVKAYDENQWAKLHDANTASVELSLMLLDGLHGRCMDLLQSLSEEQWERTIVHPERGRFILNGMLALLVWHMRHHTAHITELRKRLGWK